MRLSRFLKAFAFVILASIGLSACGDPVEVPPAYVGKMSTQNGLQDDIIPPSKFRLDDFCLNCDNLILAEASDYGVKETMQIFMPKDNLNLTVEVRGTFSVSNDKETMNRIFDRIPAEATNHERVKVIRMQRIYGTYAEPIIREVVRSVVTQYTIEEIMSQREAVGQRLAHEVATKLKPTPISVNFFGLADIQPPRIIVAAQEAAKQRNIDIEKAQADKMVKLTEAEAALEVAKKQREIDLYEADTQVQVEKKLAESVSQAFVTQRALKTLDALAKSDNKVVFLPMEAMSNPAMLLGPMQHGLQSAGR